jgi:uncharacterized protein (TIGR03083 family)
MTPDEQLDDLAAELGAAEVLTALADAATTPPPSSVRAELLAAVSNRPHAGVPPVDVAEGYERRVASLDELVDSLTGQDWWAVAAPYRWTVHGLLAHLTVVEEYTARQLGITDRPPAYADDPAMRHHLVMGASEIEQMLAGPPDVTVVRWRAAVDRVREHVRSDRFDRRASTPMNGWPFDAEAALIARCFELWTHSNDMSRAVGRPLDLPSPGELKTMSTASVGALPLLAPLETTSELTPTRFVLTGPGGGTYDLTGSIPHRNLLVADVVDYCRVVARRLEPGELGEVREGDQQLLAALLRAAQAIAM